MDMNERKRRETGYKVTLILLVALAAFSTAMKDLNRLQALVNDLQEFTAQWLGDGLLAVEAKEVSPSETSCAVDISKTADVNVDFTVHVPVGVGFIGRTVNGEISATSLSSNVVSHTVNGAIRISTSGYAQAKTVNGEISAKIGDGNWPDAIEFKTVNGEINLDLPATLSTDINADTFNGEISSDFPLSLQEKVSRKHVNGRIGNGGRSLILKTLNGSISLRRAS